MKATRNERERRKKAYPLAGSNELGLTGVSFYQKIVHQPKLIDPYNETMGLVTPGTWVDFFRFVSDRYDGILADEFDNRNIVENLMPKFAVIKEKYDVVFQPHVQGGEVSEWTEADSKLPDGSEAYYLRANTGPRYLLGGILSRPFITTKQSGGKFAITSIESSNGHPQTVLAKPFSFQEVHQVYSVLDGCIEATIDDKSNPVRAGETVFIPAGTKMSLNFIDKYTRFWSFSSGDGLETLIRMGGRQFPGTIVPDKADSVDIEAVRKAAESIDLRIEM